MGKLTCQNPLYGCGIRVVCGLQFQPGVLDILLQQALALETETHSLTDQLNQRFQRAFIRGFDALESRLPVIAIDVNTIQKQDMEVDIHVQCTTKTLNQCYGPGRAILKRISSFVDQMGRDCAVNSRNPVSPKPRLGIRHQWGSPLVTLLTEFNLLSARNNQRGFYGAMAQENDKRQNKGKTFCYR